MPVAARNHATGSQPAPAGVWRRVSLGLVVALGGAAAMTAQAERAVQDVQPTGSTVARVPAKAPPLSASQWFALPWEITFAHIDDAMSKRTYRLRQARRILNRTGSQDITSGWISVVEDLVHAAAPGQPEQFELKFVSVENMTMSAAQHQLAQSQYAGKAGFLYNFQSFRIFDVAEATKNYALTFLGLGQRAQRLVYRVAAYSRLGGRSGWLLELDLETGYPLYRGEYATSGTLVSEVEVLGFDPNYTGPVQTVAQQAGTVRYATADALATALQLPSKVVPPPGVLQAGYVFGSAKSVTDPFTGVQKGVLIYTDGIDQVFLTIASDARQSLGEGHAFTSYHDAAGITQASFVDRGLHFVVVARGADADVHALVHRLYAHVAK